MKPQCSVLFSSGLFQQVLSYIASKYACMHSKNMQSKNMHTCMQSKYAHLGLCNDVPHIWGCPTMFFGFGAVQRCSDGKKMMFPTFGSVQRCSAEEKRCFLLLGLSNDVSMGKKRCSPHLGLSNDVSPKKNDVPHIWGCPTMFFAFGLSNDVSLKKTVSSAKILMFTTFGAVQRSYVQKN